MIPRGALDIDWLTLSNAAFRSFVSVDIKEASSRIQQLWGTDRGVLVCQSVRSGLDAVLSCVNWPAGSEVLMSAVNLAEMAQIVEEHGFVPVPVDVHADSLAPDLDQLKSRVTERTRAILVAHLFGSRLDLRECAAIARDRQIELWEDVAQGYAADGFPGDSQADVSLFSFGPIKSQTALGGAVLRFRDPELASRCEHVQANWPMQPTAEYRKKLLQSMLVQFLCRHLSYTAVTAIADWTRVDLEEWLGSKIRGFDPGKFLQQLRRQPCGALVELLHNRLVHKQCDWMARKTAMAESYRQQLPCSVLLGTTASFPTRWLLPIVSRDPGTLIARLRAKGYDATARASRLRVIAAPSAHSTWTTPKALDWATRLVFLPLHPSLRTAYISEIASIVCDMESSNVPFDQH